MGKRTGIEGQRVWRALAALLALALAGTMAACQPTLPRPQPTMTLAATATADALPTARPTLPPTVVAVDEPTATPALDAVPTPAGVEQPVLYLAAAAGGLTELHLVTGAGDTILARDLDGFASLEWSPDGRRLAAVVRSDVERALLIIDVTTGSVARSLTAPPADRMAFIPAADWSRLLARVDRPGESDLWVVEVPAGTVANLTRTSGSVADWDIAGNGEWALASIEAGGDFVTTVFDLPGRQAFEVSQGAHPRAELSPDGRWLALAGRLSDDPQESLSLIDLGTISEAGEARVIVTGEAVLPAVGAGGDGKRFFSADGAWLAAVVRSAGESRLRVRALASELRMDTPLSAGEEVQWLVPYTGIRRALLATRTAAPAGVTSRLQLLYLDQGTSNVLAEGGADVTLLAENAGQVALDLATADGAGREIVVVDLAQGTARTVLRGDLRALAVDLEGQRLLAALPGSAGGEEVHLLDLQTGGTILGFGSSAGGPGMRASGEFAPAGPAVLARLWAADRSARLLVSWDGRPPAMTVSEGSLDAFFTPDGRGLVFSNDLAHAGGIFVAQAGSDTPARVGEGQVLGWRVAP